MDRLGVIPSFLILGLNAEGSQGISRVVKGWKLTGVGRLHTTLEGHTSPLLPLCHR